MLEPVGAVRRFRSIVVFTLVGAVAGCGLDPGADSGPDGGASEPDTIAVAEPTWHGEDDVADDEAYAKVLTQFRRAERGSFISDIREDGEPVRIAYVIARARTPEEKGAIVVANGRSETFEQYGELAYDLTRQGYTLYMLDHRGQGHSGRLIDYDNVGDSHYQKGTVDRFYDYVDDLHQFITDVVRPDRAGRPRRELYGLGHSMGGTVLTLYAMRHPHVLTKIALSSPMHQLDVERSFGFKWMLYWHPNDYAKGGAWTEPPRFQGNALTSSHPRFDAKQAVFAEDRSVRVGGPTYHWVDRALDGAKEARDHADLIEIPVLLLSASDDRVVERAGQVAVCDRINAKRPELCQFRGLRDSRHELLIETDEIRGRALDLITDFFTSCGSAEAAPGACRQEASLD